MASAIVKNMDLENGCRLEMADVSRKLVGDRWVVTLEVRLHVPVSREVLAQAGEASGDLEAMRAVLGETAVYVQRKEKVFVDDQDRDAVFDTLCSQFEEGPMTYLSNPRFPGRFLLKQYDEKARLGS